MLHSMQLCLGDSTGVGSSDRILAVVPMFGDETNGPDVATDAFWGGGGTGGGRRGTGRGEGTNE